jgi:hypothetical protein
MRMSFLRFALVAVGFAFAASTPTPLHAQIFNDTVNLTVVGAGVGEPGNFDLNLSGTAVAGFGTEFQFDFPQFQISVDVGSIDFQLMFVRTGSNGDLAGPVTWTLSDQTLKNSQTQIVGINTLPPTFASQLPVQSFGLIDGHTIEVTTGPATAVANQNAHFQLQFATVPEPSTLATCSWLAGAGLCWCWRKGRRSRAIAGA